MVRETQNIHLLIRDRQQDVVQFYLQRHPRWSEAQAETCWTLPTKKTVAVPGAGVMDGRSLETYVDEVMQGDLQLDVSDYCLDQELDPTSISLTSPTQQVRTSYHLYPVDVWVDPQRRGSLAAKTSGMWVTPRQGIDDLAVSPTAKAVFGKILQRESQLDAHYKLHPEEEQRPEAQRRLMVDVPERPSMDMLAKKWHSQNQSGVRFLPWNTLREILDVGDRAFNLLVADPYLRYQDQGTDMTWAFFTHKDRQDLHVHGKPTIEIYGVLSGQLEVWWKPYHARGVAAWSRRTLQPLDFIEMGPMQCHIVRWVKEGVGVVVKAGGPLAGVGKIGVQGKTKCDCNCQKPPEVVELQELLQ